MIATATATATATSERCGRDSARPERTLRHVGVGDDPQTLGSIRSDGINLAIWTRGQGVCPVSHGQLDRIDDITLDIGVEHLPVDLPRVLDDAGYPEDAIAALVPDVATLGTLLAATTDATRITIRLEVIETDACRRFHADHVTARLICTYAGPGTQWLDDTDAVRLAGGTDPAALTIRQVATGDVAVFKGRLWSPDRPIVHRSPPITATGARRLVLVIDPAPDAPIPHA